MINSFHFKTETMKKNILIYDDDEEILLLCKIILKKHDYNVQTFSSCDDVITDVRNLKPDFILMDLWIPQLGGEKAVKILKENADTKQVPIFLFSANSDIEDICHKIHADGFIAKPFDLKVFLEIIQNHVH
jgi:DNA-binding response OmpR family regulator